MKPKDRIMPSFQTNCKTLKQTTISNKTFLNNKNKPGSQHSKIRPEYLI